MRSTDPGQGRPVETSGVSACNADDSASARLWTDPFDETSDGWRLKLANIIDEHPREALDIWVDRSITADDLVERLDLLAAERGAPGHLRMDNGPELIAWALRDWCRLKGTVTSYIEPGSPWENPWIESFNGRPATNASTATSSGRSPRPG